MTQRIFDVDNPQDVKDLFDILPDDVQEIQRGIDKTVKFYNRKGLSISFSDVLAINWRDKKEIIRPVDESKWLGCLCWFWDGDLKYKSLGFLKKIDREYFGPYEEVGGACYSNCRPVRRDEVKFVEDVE